MGSEHVILVSHHDLRLVSLSVIIAIVASYVALDLASRVTASRGRTRFLWLTGGATAMGTGIWSMHFVGMLGFHLPIPVAYHIPTVTFSLLAAIASAMVALLVVSRDRLRGTRLVVGSALMGLGIVVMHYTGMAAMRLQAVVEYDTTLVALSVAVAIGVSFVALTLAFRLRGETISAWDWRKMASAVLMGAAVPAMHYTGMAAANFIPLARPDAEVVGSNISAIGLAASALAPFLVLTLTIITSLADRRLSAQALQLKHSEERFRTAFGNAPIGMALVGLDGQWIQVNQALCRILGYTEGELLATNFQALTYSDDLEADLAYVRNLLAGHIGAYAMEKRYVHKRRYLVWARLDVSLIRDQAGAPLYFISQVQDITDAKRAEAALRSVQQDLETRMVALQKAHRQLEAANHELESFSYSVSHDLRAPIRHIDGFVQLLERHAGNVLDDKSRRYLSTIAESANKMGQLIEDLLAFSRMGRSELSNSQINMDELIKEVLEELSPETAGRQIVWVVAALPDMKGDRSLFRQVFLNLVGNAIKYTRPRAVARIEIAQATGVSGEIVIYVRDNGVGFDMKYVEKLFGVFQRLHTDKEFEGTGIGLANVRRIMLRHGGRTWAEGAIDGGATFYVAMPRQV